MRDREKRYKACNEYEKVMKSDKWRKEIPYISFPLDWEVKITPGFAGAVIRFRVKKNTAEVSVYLDCYKTLGFYDDPYWEIYPYNGDTYRCDMADTEKLLIAITHSLKEQSEKEKIGK